MCIALPPLSAAERLLQEASLTLEPADEALQRRELRAQVGLEGVDLALPGVDLVLQGPDLSVERSAVYREAPARGGQVVDESAEVTGHAVRRPVAGERLGHRRRIGADGRAKLAPVEGDRAVLRR